LPPAKPISYPISSEKISSDIRTRWGKMKISQSIRQPKATSLKTITLK